MASIVVIIIYLSVPVMAYLIHARYPGTRWWEDEDTLQGDTFTASAIYIFWPIFLILFALFMPFFLVHRFLWKKQI